MVIVLQMIAILRLAIVSVFLTRSNKLNKPIWEVK